MGLYYMRGQFSILSTGHLTLLFLTLYCITDNIFNYLIDGLSGLSKMFTREFDTSFSIAKTRHIEITPLAVNFFVKFYDFVSACWCLL